VYRCMRAQCLCTRHAGWKPAHPGGAGVMGCIAVCGRNACAPGMRAGSPRTHVAYRWRRAGSPRSQVGRRRRAGSPRSRHAGWKPAHPRGISPEAGWKPAYPGGVSLYAGETPALPACGLDACAPTWHIAGGGLEARIPRWRIAVCGRDARAPSMRAGRPRTQAGHIAEAGWKPALPACGLDACAPTWHIAGGGLEARAPRWCIAVCGLQARAPSMRVRRSCSQGGLRLCDPAHYIRRHAGRPVMSQRTFRAFFVGIRSVIGAIATRCIVWQVVVIHGAESSL